MIRRGGRGPFHSSRTSGRPGDGAAVVGNAAISTLIDNFNDNSLDAALWDVGNFYDGTGTTAGSATETGGQVAVTVLTSTAGKNYTGYISHNLYDLTGDGAVVNVSGIPSNPVSQQLYLSIGPDVNHTYVMYKDGNSIIFRKQTSGSFVSVSTAITFVNASHRWWRMRESGGTMFFDAAAATSSNPPVSGDWVNVGSAVIDTDVIPDKTAVRVGFGSGTNASVASPITPKFDGFNTAT